MKFVFTVLMILAVGTALCEKQPFERYQSIVDRQMFGVPPAGFDPMKLPSEVQKLSKAEQKELTQEQEKLQSSVHFSVIRVSPEGVTQVGFTDNSDPKAPRNYFLKVGETQDGWTVKEADAAEETTTIVKDDVEVELKIGDNSGKGGGKTSKAGTTAAAAKPAGGRSGLLRFGGAQALSLRERRALRQQKAQEEKAQADAQKAEQEAVRQAQAEQERAAREEERQQQRQQLMAIQEELRKAREARQQNEQKQAETEGSGGGDDAQ